MIPIEYILIVIGVIILYIIYYIFSKDAQLTRNIRAIASAVEDANRQIYMIEKKLYEMDKKSSTTDIKRGMNDEEIYQEIERSVYDFINPVSSNIKEIERNLADLSVAVDSRLANLEGGIRQISLPSSVHGNDDSKITSLFKQGVDVDTISKELHLSKAEVEFVLKINQLR
ncbi:hypothetical protein [Sulfurimonas sp. HSL-1716]|uniref:hypothetical protein n=1 Tax=Hydrocurvibacter sulfurireducens TaxID=3131937 RepID=UPI0031F851D1